MPHSTPDHRRNPTIARHGGAGIQRGGLTLPGTALLALAALLASTASAGPHTVDLPPTAPALTAPLPTIDGCSPDATCPPALIPGTVVVDLAFDGLGSRGPAADGLLTSDEIQCAIDCLDADPAPEHVLPAKRTVYEPPPFIAGGTLVFVPESPPAGTVAAPGTKHLRYSIDAPLSLPFTRAGLSVRGDGAALRLTAPSGAPSRTVFQRTLPETLSPRDVEFLGTFSSGWLFEGLNFVNMKPGLAGVPATAIELHGAYHLVVDRCRFDGFDRGVELHFCLMPTVRDCFFVGGRDRDIMVSDGSDCGVPASRCWKGTEGWLRESGSHHARLLGNHHMTAAVGTASVEVTHSIGPVIDGPTFEGPRPQHAVLVKWTKHVVETTVRDAYIEYSEPPRGTGTFRFECGGVAAIDGFNLTSGYPDDFLVDLSAATDLRVRLSRCAWLTNGVTFSNGTNSWGNTWSFTDVQAIGAGLADPSRWRGGATSVPVRLDTGAPVVAPAPVPSPARRRRR